MTTALCPYPRFKAFYPGTGNPLVGGKLYTYQAGTVATNTTTYTGSNGSVANPNPIILDSNGECDLWLPGYVKLMLTDANNNQLWTRDNVSEQYWQTLSQSPWVAQNLANLTYSNATTFTCSGNQTVILPVGIRIEATVAAGLITGTVANSTFANSTTTVKTTWDANEALDSGLSQIATSLTASTTPTPSLIPQWDASGNINANQFNSQVATGTPPFVVASTTQVANLNSALLTGLAPATANTASTIVQRDANGNFSAGMITANLTGTASNAANSALLGGVALSNIAQKITIYSGNTGNLTYAGTYTANLANNGNQHSHYNISVYSPQYPIMQNGANGLPVNGAYWTLTQGPVNTPDQLIIYNNTSSGGSHIYYYEAWLLS